MVANCAKVGKNYAAAQKFRAIEFSVQCQRKSKEILKYSNST
jgi:hypothetical protein